MPQYRVLEIINAIKELLRFVNHTYMNYSYERAEELTHKKPKKFRLTDENKDLIQKRLTRLALAGEFYASKVL